MKPGPIKGIELAVPPHRQLQLLFCNGKMPAEHKPQFAVSLHIFIFTDNAVQITNII